MRRRIGVIMLGALMLAALMVPAMAADITLDEYDTAKYTLTPAESGLKLDVTIKNAEAQNLIVVTDKAIDPSKPGSLNDDVQILYINQAAGSGGTATFNGTNAIQPIENAAGQYYVYRSSTNTSLELVTLFSAEPSGIYGDLNGDKKINGQDALEIAKYVAHKNCVLDSLSDEMKIQKSDFNNDKKVNGQDALEIAKYVAHKPSAFD